MDKNEKGDKIYVPFYTLKELRTLYNTLYTGNNKRRKTIEENGFRKCVGNFDRKPYFKTVNDPKNLLAS